MSSDRRRFLREIARTAREVRGVSGAGRDALAEARDALLRGDEAPVAAEEESVSERDPGRLSPDEQERYGTQLALPGWSEREQLALRGTSAVVVGAGALGAPVALYLAAAGVGRLGIVDHDRVGLADLQRQLLHFTPDRGVSKAHSAAAKLGFLNPEVEVVPYEVRLDPANAAGLLDGHDLVLGPLALNPAICAAGVPAVLGAVAGLEGAAMAIRPGESACWRCARRELPAGAGALGPAAGVVGSLMALEALKLATGFAPPLVDHVLEVDLGGPALTWTPVERRSGCPDCEG